MKRAYRRAVLAIASTLVFVAVSSHAQQPVPDTHVSGVVVAVHGARIEIQLADGSRRSATADAELGTSPVGMKVQTDLEPAGDGYRRIAPQYRN